MLCVPYVHTAQSCRLTDNGGAAGVGNRGSSAVSRLVQNGRLSGAEMWCLDHDRKLLDTIDTANTVVVRKEEPHMVHACSFMLTTPEDHFVRNAWCSMCQKSTP